MKKKINTEKERGQIVEKKLNSAVLFNKGD